MAAMETAPPVIRTINIKRSSRHSSSPDPLVLSRKLEAARREQDVANIQRERRRATRNGTFVPRSASHSSADSSSTPPLSNFNSSQPIVANFSTRDSPLLARKSESSLRLRSERQSPAHHARQSEWSMSTADGRPVMTHKSMFAALNLGLADLEAMTERLEQETAKQREYICSRCRTPETPTHNQHRHKPSESRNYSRRRSVQPSSGLVAVKHGSQTAYERVDVPFDDSPRYHAISYRASEDSVREPSQRPPLQPHDRPDWTQASQYGGETATRANLFDVPSGYIFRRRNQQTTAAPEIPPTRNNIRMPSQPLQEGHLISDAVKLIKSKERRARRKSVVDFLKKF